MYKLYIAIAILLILGIIEFKKYRHILAATVLYPIMWILSFAGIIIKGKEYYEITWMMPCIVVLGYILFILGFGLTYKRQLANKLKGKNTTTQQNSMVAVGDQLLGLNIVTIVAAAIFVYTLIHLVKLIDFDNILSSLYKIKRMIDTGEKPFPYLIVVARYFFRCAIWYMSLVYFSIPKGSSYKDKDGRNIKSVVLIRLCAVSAMAFVVMFTDISRNDILMTLLPVLFIILITKRLTNIKTILFSGATFMAFIVLFVAFMYFRSGALELFKEKGVESGEDSVYHYLTSSTVAIDQLYRNGTIKLFTIEGEGGRYTLSLPAAISDMALGTELKPEVLQEWINIGPASHTNVYTYYHWLGMDFGLIYASLFQILYGMLYGCLYGRIRKGGYIETLWYAILMYPLLMMFFEDQYLAIGQTWLIIGAFMYFIQFVCRRTKMQPSVKKQTYNRVVS